MQHISERNLKEFYKIKQNQKETNTPEIRVKDDINNEFLKYGSIYIFKRRTKLIEKIGKSGRPFKGFIVITQITENSIEYN